MKKTYYSAKSLADDTWKYSSIEYKKKLLKTLGYGKEAMAFADFKNLETVVKRGGGMIARDILNLTKLKLKKEGGSVTIKW